MFAVTDKPLCASIGKPAGWSASGGKSAHFTYSWFEGRVFNRLSVFRLREQQVATFERCHVLESQPDLIYKVRVLTPTADLEKEFTVPT